jgi:hypothetical protein
MIAIKFSSYRLSPLSQPLICRLSSLDMNAIEQNNQLVGRVRRTLEDLAAIRQSLLAASEVQAGGSNENLQYLDLELAAELKSVVDAIRLLLWAYIQALSARSGRSPAEVLSWYKMELAVEMLRSARGQSGLANGCISEFEKLVNQALAAMPSKQSIM